MQGVTNSNISFFTTDYDHPSSFNTYGMSFLVLQSGHYSSVTWVNLRILSNRREIPHPEILCVVGIDRSNSVDQLPLLII